MPPAHFPVYSDQIFLQLICRNSIEVNIIIIIIIGVMIGIEGETGVGIENQTIWEEIDGGVG
jgi:hypothetical protein